LGVLRSWLFLAFDQRISLVEPLAGVTSGIGGSKCRKQALKHRLGALQNELKVDFVIGIEHQLFGEVSGLLVYFNPLIRLEQSLTRVAKDSGKIEAKIRRDKIIGLGLRCSQKIVEFSKGKKTGEAGRIRHDFGPSVQSRDQILGIQKLGEVIAPKGIRKTVVNALADGHDLR